MNNGLEGDGPYTAERPGSLPVLQVLRAAFEHRYGDNYEDQRRFYMSKCGMVAYTGTNDGRVIGQRVAEGDPEATLAYRGMAYQIAKEIGAQSVVLGGKVDAILLTGGQRLRKAARHVDRGICQPHRARARLSRRGRDARPCDGRAACAARAGGDPGVSHRMRRLQIITGHYGTGKTEYAVNLALSLAGADKKLALADLDIVNPYFRAYEQAERLQRGGHPRDRQLLRRRGGYARDRPGDLVAVSGQELVGRHRHRRRPHPAHMCWRASLTSCTRRILTSCSLSTPTAPRRTTLKRRSRRCAALRPRAVRK